MPFCRSCGLEMADDNRFCKGCGAVADESNSADGVVVATAKGVNTTTGGSWLAGQVIGLIGFLMLVVGPFMAWATAGIFSASGMQKTGNEAIVIVVLGVIGIVLAVLSLVSKRSVLSVVPLIAALVSLAMSIFYYVQLREDLSGMDNEFFAAGIGAGIYLCLVGGVLALIGAIVGGFKRKRG